MHRDVRVSREAGCRQGPMHRDVRVPLRGRMPKGTAIGRAPRPAPAPHRDVQVSREAGCRKRPALLLPCTAWASCRSRYRGEAESEEGPVDLPPAERAGHGRPALAFKRSRKAQRRKYRHFCLTHPGNCSRRCPTFPRPCGSSAPSPSGADAKIRSGRIFQCQ